VDGSSVFVMTLSEGEGEGETYRQTAPPWLIELSSPLLLPSLTPPSPCPPLLFLSSSLTSPPYFRPLLFR
jgi:hypothetical protein